MCQFFIGLLRTRPVQSIEGVRERERTKKRKASTFTTVDELKRKALVNMLAPVVCCSGNIQLFSINIRTVYDCLCFVCEYSSAVYFFFLHHFDNLHDLRHLF